MRLDPLTNTCYVHCTEWNWHTQSEDQFESVALFIIIFSHVVCATLIVTTWIKLKNLYLLLSLLVIKEHVSSHLSASDGLFH
jgi:hypothetical protein